MLPPVNIEKVRWLSKRQMMALYGLGHTALEKYLRLNLLPGAVKFGAKKNKVWRIPDPGWPYMRVLIDPVAFLEEIHLLTTRDVCILYNTTELTVRSWRRRGHLLGIFNGKEWFYSVGELRRLNERLGKSRRSCQSRHARKFAMGRLQEAAPMEEHPFQKVFTLDRKQQPSRAPGQRSGRTPPTAPDGSRDSA